MATSVEQWRRKRKESTGQRMEVEDKWKERKGRIVIIIERLRLNRTKESSRLIEANVMQWEQRILKSHVAYKRVMQMYFMSGKPCYTTRIQLEQTSYDSHNWNAEINCKIKWVIFVFVFACIEWYVLFSWWAQLFSISTKIYYHYLSSAAIQS